jgi:hypothetical protein
VEFESISLVFDSCLSLARCSFLLASNSKRRNFWEEKEWLMRSVDDDNDAWMLDAAARTVKGQTELPND